LSEESVKALAAERISKLVGVVFDDLHWNEIERHEAEKVIQGIVDHLVQGYAISTGTSDALIYEKERMRAKPIKWYRVNWPALGGQAIEYVEAFDENDAVIQAASYIPALRYQQEWLSVVEATPDVLKADGEDPSLYPTRIQKDLPPRDDWLKPYDELGV